MLIGVQQFGEADKFVESDPLGADFGGGSARLEPATEPILWPVLPQQFEHHLPALGKRAFNKLRKGLALLRSQ